MLFRSHFPMRGDWLEDPKAKAYFDNNPDFRIFAEYVARSNGIIHSDKVDVYNAVKKELWEPLVFQKKDLNTAIKDAKKAVRAVIK